MANTSAVAAAFLVFKRSPEQRDCLAVVIQCEVSPGNPKTSVGYQWLLLQLPTATHVHVSTEEMNLCITAQSPHQHLGISSILKPSRAKTLHPFWTTFFLLLSS